MPLTVPARLHWPTPVPPGQPVNVGVERSAIPNLARPKLPRTAQSAVPAASNAICAASPNPEAELSLTGAARAASNDCRLREPPCSVT